MKKLSKQLTINAILESVQKYANDKTHITRYNNALTLIELINNTPLNEYIIYKNGNIGIVGEILTMYYLHNTRHNLKLSTTKYDAIINGVELQFKLICKSKSHKLTSKCKTIIMNVLANGVEWYELDKQTSNKYVGVRFSNAIIKNNSNDFKKIASWNNKTGFITL